MAAESRRMTAEAPPDRPLLDLIGPGFHILPGRPLPLGVSETHAGLNFAVFSRHATEVRLVLYAPQAHEPVLELPLDATFHRTGDVWHIEVAALDPRVRYGWRMARQTVELNGFHRFDPSIVLLDPYAHALTGGSVWGAPERRSGEPPPSGTGIGPPPASESVDKPTPTLRGAQGERENTPEHQSATAQADAVEAGVAHSSTPSSAGIGRRRRSLFVRQDFDWDLVRPSRVPFSDKVIYELHVRGFTRDASAGVQQPGTYRGLIEKIPYIKDLGVTTVELLPVYEFDENDNPRCNPFTGERLMNYWGYSPLGFFAPKAAYAANGRNGQQVGEFKELVREFHRAGIEVLLDVVFNHTAEGRDPRSTCSFRGLDNVVYYILDPVTGAYRDYSGCGNTLNCNDPVVRNLILDALRYWVAEFHVDGFRFDLASILGRGPHGEVLARPPLLERIAADPVLADATLIAEAWDAAGLYQVGTFPTWGRWAEWNGIFRDDMRRFVRGEPGVAGRVATRLAGSADLYGGAGRGPGPSINFVTCHDGFTLADLVSYGRKHNEANGEGNRDGSAANDSWNCGIEGPTTDAAVLRLRQQQMRNLLTLLLLSQGTPMLLGGDEIGRTQAGNNNAYCQDNEISWLDWRLRERHAELHRFTKTLIAFRRSHPVLRRSTFLTGRGTRAHPQFDVSWHGTSLEQPDWSSASRSVAMHLAGAHAPSADCDVYLAANTSPEVMSFELPSLPPGVRWLRVVDTARSSPEDIADAGRESPITGGRIEVAAHACIVLRSG